MKARFFYLFFVLTPCMLFAQTRMKVTGQVANALTGEAMESVKVELHDATGKHVERRV